MKPKKFNKKLALNKKTIANLSSGQLGNVKGGVGEPSSPPCIFSYDTNCIDCPTYIQTCETCETCVTCNSCGGCTKYPCPTNTD